MHNIRDIFILFIPILIGGIIAAVNSNQTNDITERIEAWIRTRQQRASASTGKIARYVFNPLLWMVVKFCDWTDGFKHRGLKNGTRVAATLYLIAIWLAIIYAVVIIILFLVVLGVVIFIAAKLLSNSTGDSQSETAPSHSAAAIDHVGIRGKKIYSGTNWLNEELQGRVDDEGNLYKGTNWLTEEKIGRIDDDGNIYEGTSFLTENKVGRIDQDGTLHKGSNWFTEEKIGRIDEDGNILKGTNWLYEEKQGRTGD